jgi:hypothetical protein
MFFICSNTGSNCNSNRKKFISIQKSINTTKVYIYSIKMRNNKFLINYNLTLILVNNDKSTGKFLIFNFQCHIAVANNE